MGVTTMIKADIIKHITELNYPTNEYWLIIGGAFRDKGVAVWIPFKVTAKGMKNADKTGDEVFSFIHLRKHAENNILYRMKRAV